MEQTSEATSECRKCGKIVPYEQYKLSRYCPTPSCGTLLPNPRRPRHWIFQFNPATYRWFDWIRENVETEQWLISRYAKVIDKRDRVIIWASGTRAGIYATGEIITTPSKRSLNTEQEKYWIAKETVDKFEEEKSVVVRYLRMIIDGPLLEDRCRDDPILSDMEVLKQPQATNFRLTEGQWKRVLELIDGNNHKQ